MHHMSADMRACIDAWLVCYKTCLGSALALCLEHGGEHAAPRRCRLMMPALNLSDLGAFMLMQSSHHKHTGRECAGISVKCTECCCRMAA